MNREMLVAIAVGVAVFAGMAHGDIRRNTPPSRSHFTWEHQASYFSRTAKTTAKSLTHYFHLEKP